MSSKPSLLVLIVFALHMPSKAQDRKAGNAVGAPVEIVGKEKTESLTVASSQYYNLRAAGLTSYGCTVDIDWSAFFKQITGSAPPADDPTLKYLQASHLGFTDALDGDPTVKWAFSGTPPGDKVAAATKMTNGMVDVVKGFLKAWTASENGSLISLSARSLKKTANGYEIDDASGTDVDLISLDKDFIITHVVTKNEQDAGESDFSFTRRPEGLVLTKLELDDRHPPQAPAVHVLMNSTYASVDSFLLPQDVNFTVKNVASFGFRFTSCTVIRSTKTP